MGYSEWSALNNTNAFFSVYRFTLLNSSMGPVSHKPSGIMTLPPPLALTCWIASSIVVDGQLLHPVKKGIKHVAGSNRIFFIKVVIGIIYV